MVEIKEVAVGSLAEEAGLMSGDYIVSINGHPITDVLDYRFYLTVRKVKIKIHRGPDIFDVVIEKPEYDDIGLGFKTFLMDEKKSCRNKCIFCFIDQLPEGMRDTLYFKDDDSRLSFLTGSYVTLTNMSDDDIDRIIRMKMTPINISVHSTDPELRKMMLCNKNAGKVMEIMKRFADGGIEMNCQIVLCKGVNDGDHLDRTMEDLASLYPAVQSVSVVPAGLTKFRDNLYPLRPFSPEECEQIIGQVGKFAETCLKKHDSRIFFCADELYIKAGIKLPPEEDYEGYPQLENGVGLMRSMREEFEDALYDIRKFDLYSKRDVSIATGVAACEYIQTLVKRLGSVVNNFTCNVYAIKNDYFGENITVAGLITGTDLYYQLRGKDLGTTLFLPQVMLRSDGDLFLDGMSPEELEKRLDVKIRFVKNDGADFVSKLLTIEK